MWQDAEIKYSPKGSHRSFNLKNNVFKIAYFCENICRQELSKIAQSGHTGKDTFWREKEEEIEARVSGAADEQCDQKKSSNVYKVAQKWFL